MLILVKYNYPLILYGCCGSGKQSLVKILKLIYKIKEFEEEPVIKFLSLNSSTDS